MSNTYRELKFESLETKELMSGMPALLSLPETQVLHQEYRTLLDDQNTISQSVPSVDDNLVDIASVDMQTFQNRDVYTDEDLSDLQDIKDAWETILNQEGLEAEQAYEQLDALSKAMDGMHADLTRRQEGIASLRSLLIDANAELGEEKEVRRQLQAQLRESKEVITQIRNSIKDLRLQIRSSLSDDRISLRLQLTDARDQYDQERAERKEIIELRNESTSQIRALNQLRKNTRVALKTAKGESSLLKVQISELEDQWNESNQIAPQSLHDLAFASAFQEEAEEEIEECSLAIAQQEMAEQEKLMRYARMEIVPNGTSFNLRYRSPYDQTFFEIRISRTGKDGHWWTATSANHDHEGGELEGSWGYGFNNKLTNYGPTLDFEILMWNGRDREKMLDRTTGRVSRVDYQMHLETPQPDWEHSDQARIEDEPIASSLSVLQMDGPNALVHFTAPLAKSLIEITGGGILSTFEQEHEGGASSATAQVTMNAQRPRGDYEIRLMDRPNGLILERVNVHWDGNNLSLTNPEDQSQENPVNWDIPMEYSFANSVVRENFQSDLCARSGLTISSSEAEASFYEKHPEYHSDSIQKTINDLYEDSPGSLRGQVADHVYGMRNDTLERLYRGLNA